jgi:hypothetical protein
VSDPDQDMLARYRALSLDRPRLEVDAAILRAANRHVVRPARKHAAIAIAASVLITLAVGIWRPFTGARQHAAVLPNTRGGLTDGRAAPAQESFETNWAAKELDAPGFIEGRAAEALTATM